MAHVWARVGPTAFERQAPAPTAGVTRITAASLKTRTPELGKWAGALAPAADILLYRSSIAARPDGLELVNALAAATKRDGAASRHASGAGGDELFEVTAGRLKDLSAGSPRAGRCFALP